MEIVEVVALYRERVNSSLQRVCSLYRMKKKGELRKIINEIKEKERNKI